MKKILVVDVGGTNVKLSVPGGRKQSKIPSGNRLDAKRMVAKVKRATEDWSYDAISIGYPGPVRNGKPAGEPSNLAKGWVHFDFEKAFGRPVRIVNDAAMQALGVYRGGRMLFLGLGTGFGAALVADGVLVPLELAHLPYRDGRVYEDYAGARGLKRLGRRKWTRHVHRIVDLLQHALQADYVVLGGGQAKELKRRPRGVIVGTNRNAMIGGMRLWEESADGRRGVKPFVVHSRRSPAHKADTAAAAESAESKTSG